MAEAYPVFVFGRVVEAVASWQHAFYSVDCAPKISGLDKTRLFHHKPSAGDAAKTPRLIYALW
ncbi:hypothetical protein GCM10007071_29710 [Marinobacter zhanjiangensis]|uniref:Uncharacterized protein n=1 Tax=Marinobacter zhanjiangensis TaxID=578215 RepID=A0ABQ3B5Y5_9GAMM|nr:hypothetical protein GCM10007071_29710 [Marinobacter zhanjiangensis]